MHIVCPHCENPIELVKVNKREEVSCPSCGSSFHLESESTTDWHPRDGQKLGRFELIQMVGQGAFGTVYQARDVNLDRTVALKVPRAGNLGSASDLDRFLREARSVAQLRHPAIVPVYEVGQHEGVPFLVSEFVQGITLADLITGERLSPQRIVQMVAIVADALQYAHEHGVIHRDVKPSNILLDAAGAPHVMDFGLAKRDAGEITMTLDGQVLGTPAYMSPEQARGEAHQVDGRSDVYSLGVILYRLLTGSLPFKGNTRMLLHHVLHDEPKSPRKVDATIPRDLETICLKAMAKEPARRYAGARDLADDLRRFLKGEPIQARPVGALERAGKWVRRRPAAAALVAFSVLVAAAVVGMGAWIWQREMAAAAAHQVKVEYYANVVKRWGVPEGVGLLTEEQSRHRQVSYRFYRRDGRVEKMEAFNGHGAPAVGAGWRGVSNLDIFSNDAKFDRACRYEYHRNDAGQLVEEVAVDQMDQIVWVCHYTTPRVAQFTDRRGLPLTRAASGAALVEFTWSEDGFAKEVRFLDLHRKYRPDNHRVYGYRYELDARGLPLETRFLGPQGQLVNHKDGYARIASPYDALGNPVQTAYFDLEDKPVLEKTMGVAKLTVTYDAHGNPIDNSFFGLEGQPILAADMEAARWAMTWDDQGDIVEWGPLGFDGKPTMGKVGFAKERGRSDDRGNLIEIRDFGLDSKPMLNEDGWTRMSRIFDERANTLEWECYGLDDTLALCKEGYARATHAYDARSNPTEICYWGTDGKPVLNQVQGFARATTAYDDNDNPIESAFFGVDGKPILDKTKGVAREAKVYDDRNNLIEAASFGVDGKPALDRQGAARILWKYDDMGNKIEADYLGLDGKATLGKRGYTLATFAFDKDANHTDSTYFDLEGKTVRTQVVVTDHLPYYEHEEFDLKTGDILLSYDGQSLACAIKFLDDKRAEGIGEKPKELRILREGRPVMLRVPGGWTPEGFGWQLETRVP